MRGLALCVVAFGCGKGSVATGGGSAGSAAGSAVAKPDAGVAAPAAKLLFDDKTEQPELKIAFDNHVPVLPALSPDGLWLASYGSDAMMPMIPNPVFISIARLDGSGKTERLELVDMKMATDLAEAGSWDDKPPPAPIAKQVRDRGQAAVARLRDFGSLVAVTVDTTSSGDPKPAKVGNFVLASTEQPERLEVTLADASGKVVHRERRKSLETDERPTSFGGGACSYRPSFRDAYVDQAKLKLYVFVVLRHNEECTQLPQDIIVWPLSATASDAEAIEEVLTSQFGAATSDSIFTTDAQLVLASGVASRDQRPFRAKAHDDDDLQVVLARDGTSAWGSVTTKITEPGRDDPWRASSMLVKTPAGWRIAATTWSRPVANAKANKDAKAGKLAAPAALTGDAGDAALRAAFAKLVTDGVDPDAAARADLVAIGSADGERTVGGKVFAAGWNAGWKGRTTVVSSIARVSPSATTGWVAANVELAKTGYKIPFHVFCVFDKTPAGAWSLVHIHFAI